ncbi:MAG TPA: DUF1540 domain-containing protein [Candidatus Scatomonas merdavium]|nr:DUF1540 domain-containing protein [Candidatus Scatomonas merdavium]
MPALSCSAITCVYNDGELCSKGDIRIGGQNAMHADETCCESFMERKEGSMTNSMGEGCGCTNVGVYCEACDCVSNDKSKCVAGAINIDGRGACCMEDTRCGSFRCTK